MCYTASDKVGVTDRSLTGMASVLLLSWLVAAASHLALTFGFGGTLKYNERL